jgi:hypothetical protein
MKQDLALPTPEFSGEKTYNLAFSSLHVFMLRLARPGAMEKTQGLTILALATRNKESACY